MPHEYLARLAYHHPQPLQMEPKQTQQEQLLLLPQFPFQALQVYPTEVVLNTDEVLVEESSTEDNVHHMDTVPLEDIPDIPVEDAAVDVDQDTPEE